MALATPLADAFREISEALHRNQYLLVHASADVADSDEWVLAGAPTAAHHLAALADVEVCTAREWIRVGRRVRELPGLDAAFADRRISYAKARALTRFATRENEAELLALAEGHPAGQLNRALAFWVARNSSPAQLEAHHRRSRSVTWRTEADGMVVFTLRLPPQVAAMLISLLTTLVMRARPTADASGRHPTLAQQHADALELALSEGPGRVDHEVVLHVRGHGCTTDDGTPIPETVIERLAPMSFVRALIHDADGRPINASGRRRHPTTRQKRVVGERDRACVDCGREQLLEFDHVPAYERGGRTLVDELQLRCAPCHHRRHAMGG